MPRQRLRDGLPGLRWSRMEPNQKSDLREMFGPWIYIAREPLFKPRYRIVELLLFASSGLTCGLAISNLLHTMLGQHRGSLASTGLIGTVAAFQVAYFAVEYRRMNRMYEEIKAGSKRVEQMIQDAPPEAAGGPRRVQ